MSEKHNVENVGYLEHLQGDIVLADGGFDSADSVALHGVSLGIPALSRGWDQLGSVILKPLVDQQMSEYTLNELVSCDSVL